MLATHYKRDWKFVTVFMKVQFGTFVYISINNTLNKLAKFH